MLTMYLVVVLHVLGHGGVLDAVQRGTGPYAAAWLLEATAYCAVDTFAVISGYVGAKAGFRWSRLGTLWLQVLFYSVPLTLAEALCAAEPLTAKGWVRVCIKACLPVSTTAYWYITAYAGMFLFIPVLNAALETLERRRLEAALAAMFALFCTLPRFTVTVLKYGEPYSLNSGYSMAWLGILYLAGGYLRKYEIPRQVSRKKAALVFAGSTVFTWFSRGAMERLSYLVSGNFTRGELLINYLSPTIVINAVALVCFFANTQVRSRPAQALVCRLAPAALGVYLIHDSAFVRERLVRDSSAVFASYAPPKLIVCALAYAAFIYAVCTPIELLRLALFAKLGVARRCRAWEARLAQRRAARRPAE